MNNNEFEAWLSEHVRNVKKGGGRASSDPYNKALKGSERNETAPEYYNQGIEEYHHYSERYSQKKTDDDDKEQDSKESRNNSSSSSGSSKSSKSSKSSNASRSTQSAIRNIVSRAVAVGVSAVIIVNTYEAIEAKNAVLTPAPVAEVVSDVTWDEGETEKTVTVPLYDANGNLVKEVVSTITRTVVDATCTKEGSITVKVTTEDGDKTYEETEEEILEPIGHAFDEGTETVLDNGEHVIVFECDHCHEQFTISTSIKEE